MQGLARHPIDLPHEVCSGCAVRSISLCAALETEELKLLDAISAQVHFGEKQTIARQDDPAGWVFNITGGMVRLYRLLADGRRQIIGFLLPGDFLGLALSERHAFCADAVDPVTACRFSRTDFSCLVGSKPRLLQRLHEVAMHELALAQDHIVLLGRQTAGERVAAFLVQLRDRRSRHGAAGHLHLHLPLPMTRADIADYLGLTLETVSRTISRLARENLLLVVPGGVRLLDPDAIEALSLA